MEIYMKELNLYESCFNRDLKDTLLIDEISCFTENKFLESGSDTNDKFSEFITRLWESLCRFVRKIQDSIRAKVIKIKNMKLIKALKKNWNWKN